MRRTILILLLFIIGNGLLLLGTDFKPTIPLITLQIMSIWGTYKLIKDPNIFKKKEVCRCRTAGKRRRPRRMS